MSFGENADQGDLAKLKQAFGEVAVAFGSVDNLLEAFGLTDMPTAQKYGILVGIVVFTLTVVSVLMLMILGGTFERIKEQAITGEPTLQDAFKTRKNRALLLERLLDARERLLKQNYPDRPKPSGEFTNLTKMLMSTAPPKENLAVDGTDKKNTNIKHRTEQTLTGYKDNYIAAYRRCQDKPGGKLHMYQYSILFDLSLPIYVADIPLPMFHDILLQAQSWQADQKLDTKPMLVHMPLVETSLV